MVEQWLWYQEPKGWFSTVNNTEALHDHGSMQRLYHMILERQPKFQFAVVNLKDDQTKALNSRSLKS